MKKACIWMGLALALTAILAGRESKPPLPPPVASSGSDALAQAVADHVRAYSRDKFELSFAVSRIENASPLPDAAVQKIYQLIAARLETETSFSFRDSLLSFSNGRGEFNPRTLDDVNHLIYLRLVQNLNKTGIGVVIYSKRQDTVVSVRYAETEIPAGERNLLVKSDFGFSGLGFAKLAEWQPPAGLLDVCAVPSAGGPPMLLLLYPAEIEVRQLRDDRLEKSSTLKLNWGRPFYPVLHPEGRMALRQQGGTLLLAAGGNFSNASKIFRFSDGKWTETDHVDFVAQAWLTINAAPYLAGARYQTGQNTFQGRIFLLPVAADGGTTDKASLYEKSVPPFLALDVNAPGGRLESLHLIDLGYVYHQYSSEFAERLADPMLRRSGSALAVIPGQWLATSDYSSGADRLFLTGIGDGGWRPTYDQPIDGEIVFIRDGSWQGTPGFWVYVRRSRDTYDEYPLQFWGKRP
jgi:hypothetical protein